MAKQLLLLDSEGGGGTRGRGTRGVVKKKYDLSISVWYMVTGREDVLQFSPIGKVRYVNVWAPKRPWLDFGLLTRVLTTESWISIISMVVLFGLTSSFMKIPNSTVDQEKIEESKTTILITSI